MNNQVTNFMYYMYNCWNRTEAIDLFGKDLGDHIYNKWLHHRNGLGDLYWYSELDNECRSKIVERADATYGKPAGGK